MALSKIKQWTRVVVVLTTISAAIMELLDTSIVNVALFNMAGSLGVNTEDVAWVITSYAIANVIIIPLTGFLAAYFGRKNYYIVSMIIFTIASYMCGASESLWTLVFWRFIQGIGGGALLSTSQAILFDAFEPKDRGMASGLFGMGIVLGPTLGPTVGGWVMEHFDWPWIFYINLPIGFIATFLAYNFIDKKEGEGQQKANISIDYWGIGLLMLFVGPLQFVLERGEAEDWFSSPAIRILAPVAVLSLIGFIWRELSTASPAVNLRVLRFPTLALTNIFTFVLGVGLFTSVYVFPVMVQRINGYTALETGLAILWPTLVGVFLFPVVGRMMSKGVSPFPFIFIGSIMFITFGFMGATMNGEATRWDFFHVLVFRTFGIALMQLPMISMAVQGIPTAEYPGAIAINNMIRQLGGAFGVAFANNYISGHFAQHRADLVTNVYPQSQLYQERVNSIAQGLSARGSLDASEQASRLLNLAVDKQAYLLSYLDTFQMISMFFVAIFPLIFVLQYISKKKPNASVAAKDDEDAKKAMMEAH